MAEPASILLIEDEPRLRHNLQVLLESEGYRVTTAQNGAEGITKAEEEPYDLVITDIVMPEMNGFQVMDHLKTHLPDTVVLAITGYVSTESAVQALRRGAYDYFRKPFSFDAMTFTVKRLLERRKLKRQAHEVHTLSVRLASEKEHADQAIMALVEAVYAKDNYTRGHMERVGRNAARLGRHMGADEAETELLYRSGTLHDIGKIGTPDHVLNKPGALTETEWEGIRLHPVVGANILSPIRALSNVCEPVRCHHERWDASGYPAKLGNRDIPRSARILAVADVIDALHSDRAYRAGLPRDTVREIVCAGRDKLFDPEVVDAFVELFVKDEVFEPVTSCEVEQRISDAEVRHPC